MIDPASRYLWETYWHPICHRSEVAQSRNYVRLDVCGEEVVAFHDGTDVVVFDNLCPHRGARIFDGDSGHERFLCRYHGWSYANGKIFPGNREPFAAPISNPLCLPQFATAWVGDMLFASKRPTHTLDDQLAGLGSRIAEISRSCGHRSDFNAYRYDCDWRIALENALEPYHVDMVHEHSLARLELQKGTNTYFGANSLWETELGNAPMTRKLARLRPMFDIEFQFPGYWSLYLFPFSMISSTFGYSYSQQHFFPGSGDEKSCFVSRLYTARLRPGLQPDAMQSLFQSSAEINRQVFEEDNAICRRVPLRSWSSAPPPLAMQSEEKLLHFRESYRRSVPDEFGDAPPA